MPALPPERIPTAWPTTRTEGWRYTSLKGLGLTLAPGASMLTTSPLPAGVSLTAWEGLPAGLPDNGVVARALNTPDSGWQLRVSGQVETPVTLDFTGTGESLAPRLSIHLEKGARAVLIERHGFDGINLCNMIGRIVLDEGAVLHHLRVQQCGMDVTHLDTRSVSIAAGARHHHFALTTGARLSRYEPHISLIGAEAQAHLQALMLFGDGQHGDLSSFITHADPGAHSDQLVRTVLAGQARGVYQGRIAVAPGASGSDARQLSRALLLSPEAEMNAKPELEILNHDVKCSHGASMGALDEQALFYLRTRGLSEAAARALLIEGFVSDGIAALPPAFQAPLTAQIAAWLGAHHHG